MTAQVLQQSIGRPTKVVLVQQHGDPHGDAQMTLGNDLRWRWRGDNAGVSAAGAGGAIAPPTIDATIGPHVDLQEDGIFGAREGLPGLATARALLLIGGDLHRFFDGRQVVMTTAGRTGTAVLLTTGALG